MSTTKIRTKYVDPNMPKFCSLINMTLNSKNVKLARFISCIFELFSSVQKQNTAISVLCAIVIYFQL